MNDNSDGGNGSGGRIAVYFTSGSTTNLNFSANGATGANASGQGAAGTIFTKSASQTYGDLLIQNGTPDTTYYEDESQPNTPYDTALNLDSFIATSG